MKQISKISTIAAIIVLASASLYAATCPMISGNGKASTKSVVVKGGICPMGGGKAVKGGKTTVKSAAMKSGICPMSGGVSGSSMMDMSKCPVMGKTKSAASVSAVCPVTGSRIPNVSKGSRKSVYKGKTYYFSSAGSKSAFDRNPGKYVKSRK